MLARIKVHNEAVGFVFCAWEFGLCSILVVPFVLWFFARGQYLFGLVGLGLIANFLVLVALALRSLQRGEHAWGIRQFLDRERRREIYARYPRFDTNTTVLCIALVLPFITLIAVTVELSRAWASSRTRG